MLPTFDFGNVLRRIALRVTVAFSSRLWSLGKLLALTAACCGIVSAVVAYMADLTSVFPSFGDLSNVVLNFNADHDFLSLFAYMFDFETLFSILNIAFGILVYFVTFSITTFSSFAIIWWGCRVTRTTSQLIKEKAAL